MFVFFSTLLALTTFVQANEICGPKAKLLCSLCENSTANWLDTMLEDIKVVGVQTSAARDSRESDNCGKVAFFAQLLKSKYVRGPLETIKFDTVQVNEGSGYNKNTGIFTSPCAGTYVFTWTIYQLRTNKMETFLIVNHNAYALGDTQAFPRSASSTHTAVATLKRGDNVHVRVGKTAKRHLYGYRRTSFAGWML